MPDNKGVTNNINIENAYIMFRNFAGKEGKFNPAGRRNFCVRLDDPKLVKVLERDGWNVRYLKARDEGEEDTPYLQVSVSYARRPPKVLLISSHGQTRLDESTIDTLDWAEIKTADVVINPYNWEVNGKSGVKAYLNALYVTIVEDAFANKYTNDPKTTQPEMDVEDTDIPF